MAEPIQHEFKASGARLTYFEWGNPAGATVFLVHATGFHARCWDAVVAALPDDLHVFAIDMRGHGRSENAAPFVWRTFGADVSELVEHLGLRDAVGVGHSMGGHCLTQVAARHPGRFSRLVLVDPVVFEPEAYADDRYRGFSSAADHPVAKRRNQWRDWREMYARFKDRQPFSLWEDRVLQDYCRYGVVPDGADGWELACPPLVEASIYLGNTETDVYELIPSIEIPVLIARAKGREPSEHDVMDFSKSPTWPGLAGQFPRGQDLYLPHLTHFIPMQEPALVAALIVGEDVEMDVHQPEER